MGEFSGKRVTVMGLGRFGGGVGVARWLAAQGARVLATDMKGESELREPLAEIEGMVRSGVVTLRLGGHEESDFVDTDVVVANPAVPEPWNNRYIAASRHAGVRVTTEIALTWHAIERAGLRERSVGVTGTVGKSTTTSMIAHALRATGRRVLLGGNIGGSLLSELDGGGAGGGAGGGEPDLRGAWVVLELSSAMLHWLHEERLNGQGLNARVRVAVATNLRPNHVDWHGSLEHYTRSKQHLVSKLGNGDVAVLGSSLGSWASAVGAGARCVVVGESERVDGLLHTPGAHNEVNAAVALRACEEALACEGAAIGGAERARLIEAIRSFPGLAHRLQFVGRARGWRCYNDSKSTTPEATQQAVAAVGGGGGGGDAHDASSARERVSVRLIVGGYDKHVDLSLLGELARGLGARGGLYTIGQTGPTIAELARQRGATRVVECGTLELAVAAALGDEPTTGADAGVLVLSPGCASWDQYANYEYRGDEFVRLVRAHGGVL
jgi:UDP-N-acetylmuramoylalanine--D-glutamate ligase